MKPYQNLAQTCTPDGARFSLHEHDGDFFLKLNGRQLMSSSSTTSELLLAQLACETLGRRDHPRILIGGLGLGFSLKRVLELVRPSAIVHVAELLGEVVEWNRQFLMQVNGKLLDDPRVTVFVADVFHLIRDAGSAPYDAILLDVDNGPTSFVQPQNARIYGRRGFGLITRALNPGGRVAFWSATEEPAFVRDLGRAGFAVKTVEAKAHERAKRCEHRIYLGDLKPPPAPAAARPPKDRKAARRDSAS